MQLRRPAAAFHGRTRLTGTLRRRPNALSAAELASLGTVIPRRAAALLNAQPMAFRVAAELGFRVAKRVATAFAVSVFRFLTALSMLGVAWSGLAALLLEACGQLR